jgi:hypothetical protein
VGDSAAGVTASSGGDADRWQDKRWTFDKGGEKQKALRSIQPQFGRQSVADRALLG